MKNQRKDSNSVLQSEKIDHNMAAKVCQEISDELFKEKLFSKILDVSTEQLNATKAILLIYEDHALKIRAVKDEILPETIIVDSMPYKNSKDLSHQMIESTLQTKKSILKENIQVQESSDLANYFYINKVKSLLCYPILYQDQISGILYLENNVTENAFTQVKPEIIELLMKQFSISLKNSMLYSEMEKRLLDQTNEMEQQVEENVVQTEHLRLTNRDLEEKNSKINQQKKEIQEQARQLEIKNKELQKLTIVAQKTDNAILITDAIGEIEWVNEGFIQLYGYTLSEFKEEKGSTLITTSDYIEIHDIIKECIERKCTVSYAAYSTNRFAKKIWVHTTITPILDESGKITKFVAIDSDITSLKRAEEEILKHKEEIETQRDLANEQKRQIIKQNIELENHQTHLEKLVESRTKQLKFAKERAEESDRLKSSFLANMSHEIRTPMNAIIGFSELISDADIDQLQRKELVSHLNSNCNSLLHFIDDIIDIARIEAGQLRIFKQDCFINQIFIELYESFSETHVKNSHNIELLFKAENNDENLSIHTDPYRFKQVMNNLIGNALKFTDHGFVTFGYQISPEGHEDFIKFFVQDTGIGLNKKEQEEIFEQFRKAESRETDRLYRGAGLGLAISKNLINELGGTIWIESEIGQGSAFYFTLPYVTTGKKHESIEPINNHYNWENKTILISEEEESNIKMIKLVLQKTKVNIIHVQNCEKAIHKYQVHQDIDLVLLDIKMSKNNGLDATKEIRKINQKIPIIAFTTYAMSADQDNAKKAGCTDFIAKPIKKEKLLEKLDYYLKK